MTVIAKMSLGKVAIVAGGTSGVGLAASKKLLSDGFKVVVCSRHEDNVAKSLMDLKRHAKNIDNVHVMQCNIGIEKSRRKLLEEAVMRFGGIDCLVSTIRCRNKVLNFTKPNSILDLVADVKPWMQANNGGCIVFSSGMDAVVPEKNNFGTFGIVNYGLCGLTQHLSWELQDCYIRVNCVAISASEFSSLQVSKKFVLPEPLKEVSLQTVNHSKRLEAIKRLGNEDEVGKVIGFLCSDQAKCINGQTLFVSGGISHSQSGSERKSISI